MVSQNMDQIMSKFNNFETVVVPEDTAKAQISNANYINMNF